MMPDAGDRAPEMRAPAGTDPRDEGLEDRWFEKPSRPRLRATTIRPPPQSPAPLGDDVADRWFR
jgi:hypothetical protein